MSVVAAPPVLATLSEANLSYLHELLPSTARVVGAAYPQTPPEDTPAAGGAGDSVTRAAAASLTDGASVVVTLGALLGQDMSDADAEAMGALVRVSRLDPCVGPGLNWSGRLITLDNKFKSLETSIAYISTLGGGYFLCRFVAEARRCAAAQLAFAREIGDMRLVSRTLLHFVYLDIQEGRFCAARWLMRVLLHFSRTSKDSGLNACVRTAWLHAYRVKRLAVLPDANVAGAGAGAGVGAPSDTEDPFYRQRLVQAPPRASPRS